MANYKLLTHVSVGSSSEPIFTASATNTVVSSITAKDGSGQTAEVLIQKGGTSSVIELAEVSLTSNSGFQIVDVAFAMEATDILYIRSSRGGAKFIVSYVEDQDLPNDTALGGLADVDTTGVTDGQVIAYSASAGVWQPAAAGTTTGGGADELDDLDDVDTTSSASGDFLLHNGNDYVNESFSSKVAVNAAVFANSQKAGYTTALFDADFATKDADDISDTGTNHRFVTETQQTTLGNLVPVTSSLDLEDMESDITTNNNKVSADGLVTTHSDVTSAGSGEIITDAERTKLNGIDTSATANDTDANLKDRGNHTGTQNSSTISDFTVEVESIISDQINNTGDVQEGSNLYYTDARVDARIGLAKIEDLDEVSGTAPSTGQVLKWDGSQWAPAADNTSSGSGGVVDSVNGISQTAVVLDTDDIAEGTNKYTTAGDITKLAGIATGATANDTDVNLKNRNNHTGQQPASTISDFGAASAAIIAAANLQSLNNVDTPTVGEFLKWNGSTWETDTAGGGAVDSVNTQTGIVVLDADDIDDSSTTHKFVAAADVTKLGHITVANAVDLDAMAVLNTAAFTAASGAASDVSSHITSLRNHSDISYTEAVPSNIPVGSLLCWQGSEWKDQEVDLQDLHNVDTPTTGEFLKWNGSTWETDAISPSGGAVDSVNTQTGTVVLDADDIDDASTTHKFVTATDVTTLGNITAPSAVNLDTMNALAGIAFTSANTAASDISQHVTSLRNHNDVDYSEANPANIPVGSFLQWQGTAWEDGLVDLQDLDNVDAPTTGEFLKWNGSTWETDSVSSAPAGATVQDANTALSTFGNFEDGARLMSLTNTNTTLTAGKVFKLGASGWDGTTNATEAGSTGLMAMCSSTAQDGSSMILEGICRTRLSISSASVGDPIYLGTANEFTLTAPTSAATVLQLGTVVDPSNNMIYFNPDKTTITIQ